MVLGSNNGHLFDTTFTTEGVLYSAAGGVVTSTAAGTAGQVFQSAGAASPPTYSTATYPSTAGTAGSFLISDGANFMAASPTVSIGGSNVSAFGDLIAVGQTPIVQIDFTYGINTQTGVTNINTTGVVDTNASRLRLQSGVGAAGSGFLASTILSTAARSASLLVVISS
jgi:hypothetical protein